MMLTWMLPSPTWPKHGIRRENRAARSSDQVEQLRHARLGHDDVVVDLERGDHLERRARSRAAPPTAPRARRRSAARRTSVAPASRHARVDPRGFGVHLFRQAVDFDQEQRARARPAPASGRPDTPRRPPDIPRRSSSSAAGTTRARTSSRHRRHRARHIGERRAHRGLDRRLRNQSQNDLRDDREGALGPDQQMRQVVADDVLHDLAAGANDVAGRQHGFETEHVLLRHAVLERARPARTLGHVAADRRLAKACRDPADRTARRVRPRPADRR